jgi:hypothetical protein
MTEKAQGDKFPLLVYRRWSKMLRLPSLLIVIASALAWWFAPNHPWVAHRSWGFFVIACVGAVIFLYSLLARQAAYVQCQPNYVQISTPFLPLAVSYQRIVQIRPVELHSQLSLAKMKSPQRRLLEPFLPRTVLLLEVKRFPMSERRLRAWLPWYMFAKDVTGFVLTVDDWMALSRQISVFSDRSIARRQERERRPASLMERLR